MNIVEHNLSVKGQYKLQITKPDGTVTDTGWFNNLILNNGLDLLGNRISIGQYCQVGTGTSTPNVSQVTLDTELAYTALTTQGSATAPAPTYDDNVIFTFEFLQGAVVGVISEVGVGPDFTGNLFSRSLITDSGGSPTTITLTSIDQLTVYYQVTLTPTLTDATGSITLAGNSYAFRTRLYAIEGFGGLYPFVGSWAVMSNLIAYKDDFALSTITGIPDGTPTDTPNGAFYRGAYVDGTYYLDQAFAWNPAEGNDAGGIGGIIVDYVYTTKFQTLFTPAIPKTNTQTLTLTSRFSWGRA